MEARQARAPLTTDRKGGNKHDDKKSRKGDTGKYVPKPTAEGQTLAGRASKLLGRFGAAKLAGKTQGRDRRERNRKWLERDTDGAKGGSEAAATGEKAAFKKPEEFVFEGRRASAKDGRPKDLKFKGARSGKAGKKWRGKK
jgi:nucleolar protein 12